MSPKKVKITKHQMKEDKLVTTALKLSEYVRRHAKEFLMVGAGVVMVVVIVLFIVSSNKSRDQKAAELLGKARVELEASEFQPASADLQGILRSYGGTKAAQEALYLMGNSSYYSRDYDQALKHFQDFVKKYPKAEPLLLAGAYSGIGDCYLQKGEYDKAAENYLKAVNKNLDEFVIPVYLLSAARAYVKANQPDKAKKLYERIIMEYPQSKEVFQARLELAGLSVYES
jgi:TolA-binding protein